MENPIFIIAPGAPVGKGRPRFGNGHAYTPRKTKVHERAIAWHARAALVGRNPFSGPVKVSIRALFVPPKSWPKKKREDALSGQLMHTAKPDGDNIAKLVCDALNRIVFDDDSQIVSMSITKGFTASEPRTEITVESVARP